MSETEHGGFACGPEGCKPLTRAETDELLTAIHESIAARAKRLPDAETAVRAISDAVSRLRELGWRDSMYAPKDGSSLLLIEAGSSGIHKGYRDSLCFWIAGGGDLYPSSPILYRPEGGETPGNSLTLIPRTWAKRGSTTGAIRNAPRWTTPPYSRS